MRTFIELYPHHGTYLGQTYERNLQLVVKQIFGECKRHQREPTR